MIERIAVISDLHLDHWVGRDKVDSTLWLLIDRVWKQTNPDLIVVAGDVANGATTKITNIKHRGVGILVVPGNHDFYGHAMLDIINDDMHAEQQLCATTLWTNFAGDEDRKEWIYRQISDSYAIKGSSAIALANVCASRFQWIVEQNKEIVVTHFPPTRESIAPMFTGDPINSYFINDFRRQLDVAEINTKLWICGHTHWRHSHRLNNGMLIVANPLGYPFENYRNLADYSAMVLDRKTGGTWEITVDATAQR